MGRIWGHTAKEWMLVTLGKSPPVSVPVPSRAVCYGFAEGFTECLLSCSVLSLASYSYLSPQELHHSWGPLPCNIFFLTALIICYHIYINFLFCLSLYCFCSLDILGGEGWSSLPWLYLQVTSSRDLQISNIRVEMVDLYGFKTLGLDWVWFNLFLIPQGFPYNPKSQELCCNRHRQQSGTGKECWAYNPSMMDPNHPLLWSLS